MSKHLRFGKLLSLLAILLTLSFAWSQAQNLSSQKQLLTFGFTTAANPSAQLGSDVTGTIDQTAHTVAITVPYQTVTTGLIATFTSSQFSNVYGGVTIPTPPAAVSGTSPALNYASPVTWTVEAENHSFEHYVVTVTKAPASGAKDITALNASVSRPWTGNCTPNGAVTFTPAGTFNGTAVSLAVPFGTNLHAITVTYTLSAWATGAPVSGTALDFDTNSDGTPNTVNIVVTAQNGTTQTYVVSVVVGQPSYADALLTFTMANSTSLTVDNTNQTITATVPYSATTIAPAWTISPYAMMYTAEPPLVQAVPNTNICSGASFTLAGATTVIELWIQAEKTTEISRYVLTVTKDAASTANTLTSISADYSKTSACGIASTGTIVGTVGASTVTFNVPYNVSSLTVSAMVKAALSTSTTAVGTVLTNGSSIVITSESGVAKTYTVSLVAASASANKQMLTFGFDRAHNPTAPWTVDYAGVIDPVLKHVTVTVAYNTDLYALTAYFTTSEASCVTIAESNGLFTPQVSEVTVNDHSNTLTYVVTAEDGTQERYDITVLKAAALTGNSITAFTINNLPYCQLLGLSPFSVSGVINGNNITVMLPNRSSIDLTNLAYTITKSDGSTVSPATSPMSFASPVTFTVTSQAGVANVYTVTVSKYDVAANPASRKQLTKYWFQNSVNSLSVTRVDGVINEAAKTVEVWVPWGTSLTGLKAGFELNGGLSNYAGGAVMTHSEDLQAIQTSNVTPNDFTTPVAYTVFAEDCSTVEYFVTVHMTPDTSTGISAFTFNITPCATGCALVSRIDSYARRIYITVPNSVSIASLAPNSIVVAPAVNGLPAASVSPAVGVAQDWTAGPVKYTVTAPDGVTKADWMVYVTNPPCKDHNILTFSLPDIQVAPSDLVSGHGSPVVIDTVNHKIDVIVRSGASLAHVAYTRTLSCGATVCCVGGNCQDNFFLDFTSGCHTCVVTAEDQTVKQDWTICVHPIDVVVPTVTTWSVLAYNCTDSVAVQSNEAGRVFIVNETALNKTVSPWVANYNLANWTGSASVSTSVAAMVAAHLGNYATVVDSMVNKPVYVKTNGLYSGTYYAFSVDNAGRISCISAQKLFLDICEVPVADLCTLRAQTDVYLYTVTGTVNVTYLDTDAAGVNYFFAQDASCGIFVQDTRLGLTSLIANHQIKRGTTIVNLKGTIDLTSPNLVFTPVCCYEPTVTGQGVEVTPVTMTYNELNDADYWNNNHESMVVKISNPVKFTGTGNWAASTKYNIVQASGYNQWGTDMVKTFGLHTNYMGTALPTGAVYLTGVRFDGEGDGPANAGAAYGFIFPRDVKTTNVPVADVMPVAANVDIITAIPNPVAINNVVVGTCGSAAVKILSEGTSNLNITAIYLDDRAATDGFNLVTPPVVPFTIPSWTSVTVNVNFCPTVAGNKTTNLIVEYGIGKTLVIPINGTTMLIYPIPFSENFNAADAPAAWNAINMDHVNNGYNLTNNSLGYVRWGHITPESDLITPGIDLTTAGHPVLSFWFGTYYNSNFRIDISYDYTTWTTVKDYGWYTLGNGVGTVLSVDLTPYKGHIVYIKFVSTFANYYGIDDVVVQEQITTPIIAANPAVGDFGGVQVDATGTVNFSLTNVGVSILKIKSVAVTGAKFSLRDTANVYPIEVTDGPGTWAYTVGNTAKSVNFAVDFKPTDIGVVTGSLIVTYGLYADQTLVIPLTGEGLSCYTAAEAVQGRNYAPSQNTWFKYTADKFSLVQVTSCDINQKLVTNEYAWDTFLYVYSDCTGTLIASNDDMEAACTYNRASSSVTTAVNGGETIYIFWPLSFPTALHAYEGFYFNINVTYPLDGDVCENAIPLTLPVVNHFGTTAGFNNDYNASPCSPFSNYAGGNDKMYTITTTEEGYLVASILGAYGSIHVLDVCPKVELEKFHCKAFVGGPNGGSFRKKIPAGTYFVMIDTWAPPQTVDFLLNMSWESGSAVDNADLNSALTVYPNPTNGKFTVSISNVEATDMTLELVNISGQVVYRNEVKAAYSYNEDIDATTFAKGVYYLKVNSAKGAKVEKVVIQ